MKMERRYGRVTALHSLVPPALFYGLLACAILWLMWPYFYYVKHETLIVLGAFALWRYGWMLLNFVRSLLYGWYVYPRLQRQAYSLPAQEKYPDRVFFVIPSYCEEAWVSLECFQSLLSELASVPCAATVVVATGSDQDDAVIGAAYNAHPAHYKVDLVLQRQSKGKRIAMGHALRAVARRYKDDPNSVTIFMDGDSYLEPNTLRRVLPFFAAFERLGAITTNELAFINTRSNWYKEWFNLKFGQRHVLFQSHSLSRKVLTLTGRFSAFRTSAVVSEAFIRQIENDILTHWLHGRFRFLMGDDKSSWFHLLEKGWDMLYLPDVMVYSLESRDADFFDLSVSLPYRWYGNTLRNNSRALALGPKRIGGFIWWAILDQRINMWTALVGLSGALILAVTKSFVYFYFYIAWVLLVRVIQMAFIALRGHPVGMRTIPLMLYNQWVGAIVKVRAYFNLADQKWSKGGKTQSASSDRIPVPHRMAPILSRAVFVSSVSLFGFAMFLSEGALSVPTPALYKPEAQRLVIAARMFGVTPDDGHDDALALQAILDRPFAGQSVVIRLPTGRLDFYHPVQIRNNNVTIEGAGRDKTLIVSHINRQQGVAVISVEGQRGIRLAGLALDATPQTRSLLLLPGHTLKAGDYLLLRQANDKAFLATLGATRWDRTYPYLRQAIVRVVGVSGRQVSLAAQTGVRFAAANTQVFLVRPVRNVTLRRFALQQQVPNAQIAPLRFVYENRYPRYAVNEIGLDWTAGVTLERLKLLAAGSHPIAVNNSYGATIRHVFIDGAWNKGKKGNGYLRLARTYHSTVRDVTALNIRHIAIQWSSAYNRLENIRANVDINFHGGYAHDNRVRGAHIVIPSAHPWPPVYRTPDDAHWAPPDGGGNEVSGLNTTPPLGVVAP